MGKQNPASALILVLLITSTLTLLSFSCWYKSSLLLDIAIARETWYRNFYQTERALQHGCMVAKQNFDSYTKMPTTIFVNTDDDLRVHVSIQKKTEDMLHIAAMLQKEDHVLCILQCNLLKRSENSEDKNRYMVQHFTINTAV